MMMIPQCGVDQYPKRSLVIHSSARMSSGSLLQELHFLLLDQSRLLLSGSVDSCHGYFRQY